MGMRSRARSASSGWRRVALWWSQRCGWASPSAVATSWATQPSRAQPLACPWAHLLHTCCTPAALLQVPSSHALTPLVRSTPQARRRHVGADREDSLPVRPWRCDLGGLVGRGLEDPHRARRGRRHRVHLLLGGRTLLARVAAAAWRGRRLARRRCAQPSTPHPSSAPFLRTLPPHPSSAPSLCTLPLHPSSAPAPRPLHAPSPAPLHPHAFLCTLGTSAPRHLGTSAGDDALLRMIKDAVDHGVCAPHTASQEVGVAPHPKPEAFDLFTPPPHWPCACHAQRTWHAIVATQS